MGERHPLQRTRRDGWCGSLAALHPAEDRPHFDVDRDGHLAVPDAPGLGVRIDWSEVQRAAGTGESWKDEEMRLPDGTLANW